MGIIEKHNMLTGFKVCEAMRKQVITLLETESIKKAILKLIKYKTSAILLIDKDENPTGVVSKTDIMSAYYAQIPLDEELKTICVSTPIICSEEDDLEKALEIMRKNKIHRLYVYNNKNNIVGLLAYPDIVGLLYRLCSKCKSNYMLRSKQKQYVNTISKFTVKEVMTTNVQSLKQSDSLYTVMEELSQYYFGAMLIRDNMDKPVGVVSKTDLILAYKHGVSADRPVKEIMTKGVKGCDHNSYLEKAIQLMIFSDIHRLFVYRKQPENIVGVLSFTDAARMKSGSCKACLSSRIQIDR